MIRILIALLLIGPPALAQEGGPTVEVTVTPQGAVTVGTPVAVAVTVLVPTYMPKPPVWPELQIADAITRMPERATTPVSRRIGGASWAGLTRSYEIVPQRAADFDLSGDAVSVTYADPAGNQPREVSLPLPPIVLTATVPAGAEGLDPFLAATALTLTAKIDGLAEKSKPGDAFTLTLTTSATGAPAMLLPPLLDRQPVPAGLRAYPREASLSDRAGERGGSSVGTRVEVTTYVIEAPGSFALPGVRLSWWNTGTSGVETATTDAVRIEVPAPPGWRPPGEAGRRAGPLLIAAASAVLVLAGGAVLMLRKRRSAAPPARPSERVLYRRLRAGIARGPIGSIRPALADWLAARPGETAGAEVQAALLALERTRYGPAPDAAAGLGARRPLLAALRDRRSTRRYGSAVALAILPPLNPV